MHVEHSSGQKWGVQTRQSSWYTDRGTYASSNRISKQPSLVAFKKWWSGQELLRQFSLSLCVDSCVWLTQPSTSCLTKSCLRVPKKSLPCSRFLKGLQTPNRWTPHLKRGSVKWFNHMKDHYNYKDLFAHVQQRANAWWYPASKYLKDRDRLKALRLRTNLTPTRTLSNRHSSDPAARACRCRAERPETNFHTIQECESVSLVRQERHNFAARQVARISRERNSRGGWS